ncbi:MULTISPECIES: hypothetical protein [unclassified Leptolyngbya]|uniref:hypothetical protein n=1 Tax=unclassified Leptolyngbya TaxID=2650499 RepID=UPI001685E51A|nr:MULTISPECIES: hypothetical protein [unclassified Leptolyngbya]MBD1909856.1 hypothetical protein [Leptolyngbya sp. FACHB-8]MBD2156952.1 hypothetical protein [Leptolyngbya sp. FACHB-16]
MRSMLRVLLYSLLGLMLTLFLGCSSGQNVSPQPAPTTEVSSEAVAPQASKVKVKFKREDGTEAFSLEFRSDGAKLEGANGDELARFTVDDNQKVKVKNATDTALAYIVSDSDKWKVENADQTKELYILRRQSDGDYKFETGSDQDIYRVKQRDYGFEIETPDKVSVYKVKLKEGKLSLRDASDQTVLYTKDPLTPIALAPFGFKELTPEQQAGLAYALHRAGS